LFCLILSLKLIHFQFFVLKYHTFSKKGLISRLYLKR